jgi:superfamily II DNA or RNA helicase
LCKIFTNVAARITLHESVASGFLMPPKYFVIKTDPQNRVKTCLESADAAPTTSERASLRREAECQLRKIDLKEVVRHWKEKAQGRKTVVFCARIEFSKTVAEAFNVGGIKAAHIDSKMSKEARELALEGFTRGDTEVMCNVSVFNEGWDHPPTSCVVLLRARSSRPAMQQMIGRGLRAVDNDKYPGVQKADCVVLDFGLTLQTHGLAEAEVRPAAFAPALRLFYGCFAPSLTASPRPRFARRPKARPLPRRPGTNPDHVTSVLHLVST